MAARILILGAGFGGLFTALQAARLVGDRATITLVDRNDYFLYTPLLFQVVSGTLQPRHVARPIAPLLPPRIRFVRAAVHTIDLDRRRVETDDGSLEYDLLVIALGGVPNFFGLMSAEQHALPFKWLPDVPSLRAHIEERFVQAAHHPDRAADLLRTVVTGAGCTGVELAAELHDWMYGSLAPSHPAVPPSAIGITVAEALDHLLCPMDPGLRRAALRKLTERRIAVQLSSLVTGVGPDWIEYRSNGEATRVACGTVVWTAGITPSPVVSALPVTFGPGGRIVVSETLQVLGHPDVLAVGDLAACADPQGAILPTTAQVAVQQAPAAVRTLAALIEGRVPQPFRYKRQGEVVGLGRTGALVEAFGVKMVGLPAWLVGRIIHLSRLPDWGDRVAVAWEWARDLLR
ncbi:MAG TPA: NAD(P)/FAD-dependent oxidoreductase [bacterium]|nr:NAD(P)/FAD-dependent oxidoreductase [bacterium]